MNYAEITAAIGTLAGAIACRLTPGELALAASIFVQLGDTLATFAANEALREERAEEKAKDA